ncbi:cation transporter [Flavobacteriales bacterium AH-315-E23]|nr:cation transporter [Flavobacteriales bacterium AH-315-E23]
MKAILSLLLVFAITLISYGQNGTTHTFRIEGMTCNNCANTATKALSKMKGVSSAKVVFESKTATVVAADSITREDLRQKIKSINFEALFDSDSLAPELTKEEKEKLNIQVVKGGDKIKVKDYLATDTITIFDFYADWCGPCRVFSPKLERLLIDHPKVKLVKVDIVAWKSALSKQLTKEYQFPALPFVLIFDDQGKLLGKVQGNFIEKVEAVLNKNEKKG